MKEHQNHYRTIGWHYDVTMDHIITSNRYDYDITWIAL